MWISKRKYETLMREMEMARKECIKARREIDDKVYGMAKKILRQPYELSQEIQNREDTDKMINKFIKEKVLYEII